MGMQRGFFRLLSADVPQNRWLRLALTLIVLGLVLAPFLTSGVKALDVAAKMVVFIVLAASFDLLLGYTGIVSFAHTMFFGIGAYGVAIACAKWEPSWLAIASGVAAALCLSAVLALLIGLFSLRVRAIFFAMVSLAVATAFMTLMSQMSDITGGEDGLSFGVPEVLTPGFLVMPTPVLGVNITGKVLCYYLLVVLALVLFLLLLRVVNSPFGRVLQAIRENEFRAEALGFAVLVYRSASSVIAASFACMAGVMLALWLRYNGPDTSLSFEIMMDVLLIVVIGGMGTLYGSVVGAVLFLLAQSYLQDLLQWASEAAGTVPMLAALLSPDRWLLWLGLLFVLSVYYYPGGIIGSLARKTSAPRRVSDPDQPAAPSH